MKEGLKQQIALIRLELAKQIQRLSYDSATMQTYRNTLLNKLVTHAKTHSPWHRQRLKAIDNPSLENLHQLPIMNKSLAMNHWDEIICDQALTLKQVEEHLKNQTDHSLINNNYHA